MNIAFEKYHGAGNDFIMIEAKDLPGELFTQNLVKFLCDRHFGIGADGLILLLESKNADFRMKYFNSDGKEGTMCGNGGRCITAFACHKGWIEKKTLFEGIDGKHEALINDDGKVRLRMIDVQDISVLSDGYLIETGSRHFVRFVENIDLIDVYNQGRKIRHQSRFAPEGTNVNFVKIDSPGQISIRTFERGVENETLACGTGAVASAISAYMFEKNDISSYAVNVKGGMLQVEFSPNNQHLFTKVWLEGPAEFVYKGIVCI